MLAKDAGDFAAARRHYRRALAIVSAHRADSALELADLYHNLGGLEHARGRFAAGEPLARRAVRLRARRHGADATVTWLDRTALAALLDGLGRFRESEAIYRAALVRFRRRLGVDHYEVAVTLNNLGCACADQGRIAEGMRMLRRALALKEALFGKQHIEVAVDPQQPRHHAGTGRSHRGGAGALAACRDDLHATPRPHPPEHSGVPREPAVVLIHRSQPNQRPRQDSNLRPLA